MKSMWFPLRACFGTAALILLLTTGSSVFSQNLAEGAPPSSRSLPSTTLDREAAARRFVHDKLDLWQKRLQLEEWSIQVEIISPSDLRQGTLGNVRWDPEKKTARIRVLSVADYQMPVDRALADMEDTIVHELIHLRLASVWQHTPNRTEESRAAEEEAVVRIAQTLLELDRK